MGNCPMPLPVPSRGPCGTGCAPGPNAALSIGDGVGAIIPGTLGGADAKRIGEAVAHGMPVGDAEAEVVTHLLARHDFVGVVVLEGERVLGFWTLKLDLLDVRKSFAHQVVCWRAHETRVGRSVKLQSSDEI